MYFKDAAKSGIIAVAGDVKDLKISEIGKMVRPSKMRGDIRERAEGCKAQFQGLQGGVVVVNERNQQVAHEFRAFICRTIG